MSIFVGESEATSVPTSVAAVDKMECWALTDMAGGTGKGGEAAARGVAGVAMDCQRL